MLAKLAYRDLPPSFCVKQAQYLAQMLARLDSADRDMVLAMVEQLTNRLAKQS
jgi:hypothetical protein